MKIAFLTTDITKSAGTERVVVNLSNFFVEAGYHVQIHSLSSRESSSFYPLNERIEIFHHGMEDYATEASRFKIIRKKIFNTARIPSILSSIKADVLIGTGKHINIYMAFFMGKKTTRIGCEHFPHNAPMSSLTHKLRKVAYKKLEHLVVLTEDDRSYYSSFIKNVHCIPNSLSFYPDLHASLDNKVVLSVGRHTAQKGFDMLIESWALVIKDHPDWQLKIIGDGPLLSEHQALAAQKGLANTISFQEPTRQIIDEYTKAGLYTMSSRFEAFPMVLLEAMACGLPCISFDCDTGPRDIISNNEDGFIIPPGNITLLAEGIKKMISDVPLRKKMGDLARKNIKRYDINIVGEKWISLFNEIPQRL
ncbi:glycosyltransferase family 4 protein [Chitinophaga niabensis]|uniref:Glycosyltransferase involved in cell wall bisynthesis n=1 Tax=Chitinophaga niabensis TaxID=536979 RepID=A0A1N6JXK7_9BACT|nr:glycosyltransferase family 4 protein [Chitinophaga niabensis]SIO49068.1 Glycosyltransferase involved in cell wall bisynthesis [Chitinophaga niabensis]